MEKNSKSYELDEPGFFDLGAELERSRRMDLIDAQIAAVEADRNLSLEQHAKMRNAKTEGSCARARRTDAVIIAALASVGGYLNGTDSENTRALIKDAEKKGVKLEIDDKTFDERTVEKRLIEARMHIEKHK